MAHAAHTTVSNRRLFAAADMLLGAISSPSGFDSVVPMYVGADPARSPLPPTVFTADELVDGMALLIRMGVVEGTPRTESRPLGEVCREGVTAHLSEAPRITPRPISPRQRQMPRPATDDALVGCTPPGKTSSMSRRIHPRPAPGRVDQPAASFNEAPPKPRRRSRSGKVRPMILLWALGVPIPLILIVLLIRSCMS